MFNWLDDGAIYVNDPVMDVSADNDWSQVKVWNIRSGSWGTRVYMVQGFIGPGPANPPPVVASYDPDSGKLRWGGDVAANSAQPGTLAPASFGEDTWKWLYLQPLTESQR